MRLAILFLMSTGILCAQEIAHSTSPQITHAAKPVYTKEAFAAKLQGTVILSTVIGVDGLPTEIKVTRGLGMGLDEKAVECLKLWRFKPGTRYDEPVPMRASIEINFRLPTAAP
jgi:protein TonB